MNIDDIVKLAAQFEKLANDDNSPRIQNAMGLASQTLNELDIYEDQKLYGVVRQITGFLSNMWKERNAPHFQEMLQNDIPALKTMMAYSLEMAQGNARANLMRAYRLINEVRV